MHELQRHWKGSKELKMRNWYTILKRAAAEHFYPQLIGRLRKYHGKGLWIHFSDVAKLGINTTPSHRDPTGIYFFPLDHIADNFDQYSHWSFRRYFFVCKVNAKNPVNLSTLNEQEADKHLQSLNIPKVPASLGKNEQPLPGRDLWNSIEHPLENSTDQQNSNGRYNVPFRSQFQKLGIDAIIDNGSSIIHSNEPNQMIVLDPSIIQVVEMVEANTNTRGGVATNSDNEYYKNKKYPFYSQNTKPVIELLNSLSSSLSLTPDGSPRGMGKGNWILKAKDQKGNGISLSITMRRSGAVDFKSFRMEFMASWYSAGKHMSFNDYEDSGSFRRNAYDFNIHSPYDDAIAAVSEKLKKQLTASPMDDRSFVKEPIQLLAKAIGSNEIKTESPVSACVSKTIGGTKLTIWLDYREEKGGLQVHGNAKVPETYVYPTYPLTFGTYGSNEEAVFQLKDIPAGVLANVNSQLKDIMAKHFSTPSGANQYIASKMQPVFAFLAGNA
jgi:hypothetical protein